MNKRNVFDILDNSGLIGSKLVNTFLSFYQILRLTFF